MLALQEVDLPAILLRWRPYRKVEPDHPVRSMLEQQFVKLLLCFVRIVQQNTRIANQLLLPRHANIDRAPRQMIRGRHSPNLPIQLRRPIPAGYNDRLLGVWSRLFGVWSRNNLGVWSRNKVFPENFYFRDLTPSIPTQHISFVVPRPQRLQPHTHPFQILNIYPRRNIVDLRMRLTPRQLPERKVWR